MNWDNVLAPLLKLLRELAPAIAAYLAGKAQAKSEAREGVLHDVEKAQEVSDNIIRLPAADVHQRLCDKWKK